MEIIALAYEILINLLGVIVGLADLIFILELLSWISKSLAEPFSLDRKFNPIFTGIGYSIYGAAIGALSLLIFSKPFITSQSMQKFNLVIAPLLCGLMMQYYGNYRERLGKRTIRLASFAYGAIFAFAMAIVRYIYLK